MDANALISSVALIIVLLILIGNINGGVYVREKMPPFLFHINSIRFYDVSVSRERNAGFNNIFALIYVCQYVGSPLNEENIFLEPFFFFMEATFIFYLNERI